PSRVALKGFIARGTASFSPDALGPDLGIGHRETRRYPALLRPGYRRIAQTVRHEQGPKKVVWEEVALAGLGETVRQAG
ncbi:MAG: hypothetical protein K2P78_05770, partial [Gemmataceae bacterium]|nr:hypothetical protein [Gemmataceae bacterium]